MFNSAYEISPRFLHQLEGFGAANLTMQAKCVSPTTVAMVTKIYKYAHFTINLLKCKISPRFLDRTGCFGGQSISLWFKFLHTDPYCHGNKNW